MVVVLTIALVGSCVLGFVFGYAAGRAGCTVESTFIDGLSEPREAVGPLWSRPAPYDQDIDP